MKQKPIFKIMKTKEQDLDSTKRFENGNILDQVEEPFNVEALPEQLQLTYGMLTPIMKPVQ